MKIARGVISKLNLLKENYLLHSLSTIIKLKCGTGGINPNFYPKKPIYSSLIKLSSRIFQTKTIHFRCSLISELFNRCSYTYPVMVAQMVRHSTCLNIWEIHSSIDLTMAIKIEIVLKLESHAYNLFTCFDIEGSLYLLQSDGSVWIVIN